MSEEGKEAIKMLDKYITEHKLFNIKQAENLEDNIEVVLHLVDEIYAKTEQQRDLLKYKTERIEELKKEIVQEREKNKELEVELIQKDLDIHGLKEDRRIAIEEIAEHINEEKTQEFRERIDYLEDLIDAMQTYTSITVEYLEECIKNDK